MQEQEESNTTSAIWTHDEIQELLHVRTEEEISRQLLGTVINSIVYTCGTCGQAHLLPSTGRSLYYMCWWGMCEQAVTGGQVG